LACTAAVLGLFSSGYIPGLRAEAHNDTITMRNQQVIKNVTVLKETFTKVQFKGKDIESSYPYSMIDSIKHGDEPLAYGRGIGLMEKGDFKEAIDSFIKARETPDARAWVRQYTTFHIGRCHRLAGELSAAIKEYEGLLSPEADSIFRPQAYEEIARCHLGMKGDTNLQKALESFRKLTEFGDEWVLRAKQGECLGLEAKDDFKGAAAKYDDLAKGITDRKKFLEILILAYKGRGQCLLKSNETVEAVKAFSELQKAARESQSVRGMAVAHNGLGDCNRKLRKYEDAALEYLRAPLIYSEGKERDIEEEVARGLYCAGECFHLLAQEKILATTDDERREQLMKQVIWKARADELFKEVMEKHAGTSWAAQAREKLQVKE
jgi:tetratricopeptide (TPR) repeat protein